LLGNYQLFSQFFVTNIADARYNTVSFSAHDLSSTMQGYYSSVVMCRNAKHMRMHNKITKSSAVPKFLRESLILPNRIFEVTIVLFNLWSVFCL